MQFSIKSDFKDVERQFDELPERIAESAASAGAALAQQLAARIRELIPDNGGWLDIYRNAIDFIEISPTQWGVAGIAQLPFDKIEADSSLIWLQGGGRESALLGQYNPWTLSELPSIAGGITADVLVRPASESEVKFHCERLRAELKSIRLLMTRVGATIQDDGLPTVNGNVLADIDFLSRRLEFGLCGFPRTPIWAKVAGDAQAITDSKRVAGVFDKQLHGTKKSTRPPHDSGAAADIKHGAS